MINIENRFYYHWKVKKNDVVLELQKSINVIFPRSVEIIQQKMERVGENKVRSVVSFLIPSSLIAIDQSTSLKSNKLLLEIELLT